MSNELQVFENEHFGKVRTVTGNDGEPWFVASDIARVLEMSDATHAVRGLEEDEKGLHKVETPSGMQDMAVITEAGLYTVLVRSNKEIAKPFRHWVTHEVLPSIRKTGAYSLAPRTLQEALRAYADELDAHENTRKALTASNEQVEGLKVRLDESESFWSILTLCERYGFNWDIKKRGLAGKRASAYCRRHGYEIRRAHDDRFGDVNTYPCEVLQGTGSEFLDVEIEEKNLEAELGREGQLRAEQKLITLIKEQGGEIRSNPCSLSDGTRIIRAGVTPSGLREISNDPLVRHVAPAAFFVADKF